MAENESELKDFESYTEDSQNSYGEEKIQITESGGDGLMFEEEVVITKLN